MNEDSTRRKFRHLTRARNTAFATIRRRHGIRRLSSAASMQGLVRNCFIRMQIGKVRSNPILPI
jgi:hypothetical protein